MFGTTNQGGANNRGTFWSFNTNSRTFTKLHDFPRGSGGNTGGPIGGVAVSDATVFGTTGYGDRNDTIWSFDANTFAKLHDFSEVPDGRSPEGGVAVSGGTVFGTARWGGANFDGTLWSFNTRTNTFTNLHDFSGQSDGERPVGGVAVSGTRIVGTASEGGANNNGTIWSFDTTTNRFTKLHDFSVPEPATATLGAMCGVVALMLRNTRRRP